METAAMRIDIPAELNPYVTTTSVVTFAPGRINLLGEHTDYNEGFVMPAAIDKGIYLALTPVHGNVIHLHSLDLDRTYYSTGRKLEPSADEPWANYLLGIISGFQQAGIQIPGVSAVFTGDIPIGVGVSSSAAVECAMAVALNAYTGAGFDDLRLAIIAQKAEHDFAGVKCGIMDQYASIFGKADSIIQLDCRSLQHTYRPFILNGFKLVLFDSGVKHSLAASQYNIRRQQCEAGVAMVQEHYPDAKSLRDISLAMLEQYVLPADEIIYNRCRYVVEENARVGQVSALLDAGDIEGVGGKMFETHDGLSQLYEVSCEELDSLVDFVRSNDNVLGSRMMGGGFGGCTLNLIREDTLPEVVERLTHAYKERYKMELKIYPVSISDGAGILYHG